MNDSEVLRRRIALLLTEVEERPSLADVLTMSPAERADAITYKMGCTLPLRIPFYELPDCHSTHALRYGRGTAHVSAAMSTVHLSLNWGTVSCPDCRRRAIASCQLILFDCCLRGTAMLSDPRSQLQFDGTACERFVCRLA